MNFFPTRPLPDLYKPCNFQFHCSTYKNHSHSCTYHLVHIAYFLEDRNLKQDAVLAWCRSVLHSPSQQACKKNNKAIYVFFYYLCHDMFVTVMVSMFRFFQALESFFLRDRGRIGIEGYPRRSQEVKFQPNFGHFSTTPSQSKKWFKQNQSHLLKAQRLLIRM